MDPTTPTPTPGSQPDQSGDAARWLAAAVARIEDDPALLDALSDEDVAALLAAERTSAAGVAAAIRRRVQEAERAPVRRAVRWRRPVGVGTLALAAVLAVWMLRPAVPTPAETILSYRTELAAIAATGPRIKGVPARAQAQAARDLAAAAEASPPDTALARRAGDAFAAVDDETGEAAFFAALAYRLAGDAGAAERWFQTIPPESPFADDARAVR